MKADRWWAHSLDESARWLDHPSRIGEVRRATRALAEGLGWPGHRAEEAAIVASEMASNVVRHGGTGWQLTRRIGPAIELLALDQGPGMEDPARCFADGFSTTGTAGIGLGAIRRLSDAHSLHTRPGEGTALFARLGPPPPLGLRLGVAARPFPGQSVSGDGWRIDCLGGLIRLIVVDGLGHGPGAATAAERALRCAAESGSEAPVAMIDDLERGLIGTRGAAATVATIDLRRGELTFAGVGNVAALYERGEESASLVPRFGVLGSGAPVGTVRAASHPWGPGARLIVHTDGISERWRAGVRRSRRRTDPPLLAGRILRDHLRRTDDAACVVLAAEEAER